MQHKNILPHLLGHSLPWLKNLWIEQRHTPSKVWQILLQLLPLQLPFLKSVICENQISIQNINGHSRIILVFNVYKSNLPASWILSVNALSSSAGNSTAGVHWEIKGMIVIPAWPPTTGQFTSCGSKPLSSEMNLFARTISKVVTPKILAGLYL